MGNPRYVVGLDVGGTSVNATVLGDRGLFLVDRLIELPSRVVEGPPASLAAIGEALAAVLRATGVARSDVAAVGLDTPGPASADGVISSRGATNFSAPEWWAYDFRTAVEDLLGVPVVYNNDGNAAALYAHRQHFGPAAMERSSVAAIVGTGFGGGVIESGQVVRGASGMAGELGHVPIPMEGLLEHDQFVPLCNCGGAGDVESVASLSGITNNLLPYWLARHADHPLHAVESIGAAARQVRAMAEHGDEMALQIFAQQAKAIGRLFTLASNFTDPHAYFVGGGVVETAPHFRAWFMERVQDAAQLRDEQRRVATFAVVPDLDMAGARGSALAAFQALGS
jgi:predicted NBD/HSP70 family sugar kinase